MLNPTAKVRYVGLDHVKKGWTGVATFNGDGTANVSWDDESVQSVNVNVLDLRPLL